MPDETLNDAEAPEGDSDDRHVSLTQVGEDIVVGQPHDDLPPPPVPDAPKSMTPVVHEPALSKEGQSALRKLFTEVDAMPQSRAKAVCKAAIRQINQAIA